jgi:hypothetical protein
MIVDQVLDEYILFFALRKRAHARPAACKFMVSGQEALEALIAG